VASLIYKRKCGHPDFWSLKNYRNIENFQHIGLEGTYKEPVNDLRICELYNIGWDGNDPSSLKSGVVLYRNGDIRAHGVIFEELDKIYKYLTNFKDFHNISTPQDYKDFVALKFRILSYIYNKMTKEKIIGGNIDVILLEKP